MGTGPTQVKLPIPKEIEALVREFDFEGQQIAWVTGVRDGWWVIAVPEHNETYIYHKIVERGYHLAKTETPYYRDILVRPVQPGE